MSDNMLESNFLAFPTFLGFPPVRLNPIKTRNIPWAVLNEEKIEKIEKSNYHSPAPVLQWHSITGNTLCNSI